MKTRMKRPLPVVALLLAALGFGGAAGAQPAGTAAEAQALLARAAVEVKANERFALARFNNPYGGFKDRDLYVFCFDRRSGNILAGQPATVGKDVRSFMDPTGKMFGEEMFANVKDGAVITVDYFFPRPNSTVPVATESFVEGFGNIACGVGYYNVSASAQAPGGSSRSAREQHACAVVLGLNPAGPLYEACIASLDHTLSMLDQAGRASVRRNDCIRAGLQPGTPSFAGCLEAGPGF